ncbi:MAG: formyl-CoA transferase [Dehalococcoidia bacterium]|nr:formyl-CoA transferase [Dehalococcoidia bacterium]MYD29507.1 formyl-CoA transferase [Dehalococcoidia bacterium]
MRNAPQAPARGQGVSSRQSFRRDRMPALDGMRVLDMTQYEAGTSCTQLLAWLGADVVKIESPRGDPGRGVVAAAGLPQYFLNYNSNKRSIVIDLASEEGRDLLLRMAPKFDVFVENYGPGVIEKLNLTYDVMKKANPSIIYARLKGFGLSGPYSGFPSYDWVAQASAGTFSVTGRAGDPPTRPGPTIGDSGTGAQLALSITAAYVQKQRTGEGQFIEISMQEAVTLFMRTLGLRTWGEAPQERTGNARGPGTDVYPCKGGGENDYIFVMVVTTAQWDAFCMTIGMPELISDPRFETQRGRFEHGAEFFDIVKEWTLQRTKHEAMKELGSAGVPCSATLDTYELFTDPHLSERGMVEELDHPELGTVKVMRMPALLSGSDVPMEVAPTLGQHTREVLCELDFSEDELEGLFDQGVIG